MQCHDPFYICKYYTDYFVYRVDQRETVEEIEINTQLMAYTSQGKRQSCLGPWF